MEPCRLALPPGRARRTSCGAIRPALRRPIRTTSLQSTSGACCPPGVTIHSKAGHNLWTGDPKASYFKHDMIRVQAEGQPPLTLVLMTQGKTICADRPEVFPEIGRMLFDLVTEDTLAHAD